jgi:hypothetical protein
MPHENFDFDLQSTKNTKRRSNFAKMAPTAVVMQWKYGDEFCKIIHISNITGKLLLES